jgi:hypothetical protein
MLCDLNVFKRLHFETLTYYEVCMFCDVYVLELLRFETLTFSDAMLCDKNVV